MWMSAHPKAPSEVLFQGEWVGLDRSIAEHPQTLLGSYANIHGGTLPFLLKVLAAEEPLSIQAHPDLAQAREGFQRKTTGGSH
jgi:mannose-6-phosphate isomerase